jgi:hypothetical protein
MTTIEELDVLIKAIEDSPTYRELRIISRGPADARRLDELVLKINSYKNLKRSLIEKQNVNTALTAVKTSAPTNRGKIGQMKARGRNVELEPAKSKVLSNEKEKEVSKEPEEPKLPPPRIPPAVKKGMAPVPVPEPEPAPSAMSTSGKVNTKGSVKAKPKDSTHKAPMSKTPQSFIKPQEKPKPEFVDLDLDGLDDLDEDNIDALESLDIDDDFGDLYED